MLNDIARLNLAKKPQFWSKYRVSSEAVKIIFFYMKHLDSFLSPPCVCCYSEPPVRANQLLNWLPLTLLSIAFFLIHLPDTWLAERCALARSSCPQVSKSNSEFYCCVTCDINRVSTKHLCFPTKLIYSAFTKIICLSLWCKLTRQIFGYRNLACCYLIPVIYLLSANDLSWALIGFTIRVDNISSHSSCTGSKDSHAYSW